jgi:excisionase family DNA binding protein
MSELLTLEEAADRLKIAPKTMRDWLRTGKLRGVKTGKYWRVREEDVETFVREHLRAIPAAERDPAPTEQAPPVDCAATLLSLVKSLLPEGKQVYLREKGITELPLGALNVILEQHGYTIHATKERDRRRQVACIGRDGRAERFGRFELRTTRQ